MRHNARFGAWLGTLVVTLVASAAPLPCFGQVFPEKLVFKEPVPGQVVLSGRNFTVTVVAPPGFTPSEVSIGTTVGSVYLTEPPFTTTLRVPDDHLGPIAIGAIAKDKTSQFAFAEGIQIQARTDARLERIDVAYSPMTLILGPEPTGRILVVGHFDDGVDRWVSGAAFGTTYKSQKPAIVTVDAEGRVLAHSLGTAVIDVANGEARDQATVHVSPDRR